MDQKGLGVVANCNVNITGNFQTHQLDCICCCSRRRQYLGNRSVTSRQEKQCSGYQEVIILINQTKVLPLNKKIITYIAIVNYNLFSKLHLVSSISTIREIDIT